MYRELTDEQRFALDLDEVKGYVDRGEVTWDEHRAFCRMYASVLDEEEELDAIAKKRGRPIEYPESPYHKSNREAQSRFQERRRRIRWAMREGIRVDGRVKKEIISKIRWLNANGVKVVMGRLVKEVEPVLSSNHLILNSCLISNNYVDKEWYIPYAVEVMCNEGLLEKRRKVVRIL